MRRLFLMPLVVAASMMVTACLGTAQAPPQLPAPVTNISRGAVDFALNAFDAALYAVDFAIESGRIVPGSERAKQIAVVGRKVQAALRAVEAARDAGNSASYEQAFANANAALSQFRTLIGKGPSAGLDGPPLTPGDRSTILAKLSA